MSAALIPFPAARRLARVKQIAATMARLSADRSENHLVTQIRFEYERLLDLGVPIELVEDDMIAYAQAIRTQLWVEVFARPGGGAA